MFQIQDLHFILMKKKALLRKDDDNDDSHSHVDEDDGVMLDMGDMVTVDATGIFEDEEPPVSSRKEGPAQVEASSGLYYAQLTQPEFLSDAGPRKHQSDFFYRRLRSRQKISLLDYVTLIFYCTGVGAYLPIFY